MNIYDFAPIKALIAAASWLVTTLDGALAPLVGPPSAALAIVLVTIVVRAALVPVGLSQARAALVRQRIAPKLAELQRRYRTRPEVLQRKVAELYASEKTSPMAGCLPVLAQTPVLMAVYGLFVVPTVGGRANGLLGHAFLGIPLGTRFVALLSAGSAGWPAVAVFVSVMVVIAVVAQASRRWLAPPPAPAAPTAPGSPDLSRLTSALSFLPFMTAIVAAFVPLAAAFYLMTTTVWSFGERLVLRRVLGPGPTPDPTPR